MLGGGVDEAAPLPHALEVTALTRDGADGPALELAAAHPGGMFADGDVEAVLREWVAVLDEYAAAADAGRIGGRTPSDLTLLPGLGQQDVDAIDARLGADTEVMPLTPMQQGLVFHASLGAEDVYLVQFAITLHGPVDGARLRDALAATVEHHVGLGQGFWRDAPGPHGVVAFRPADVSLPWREVTLEQGDGADAVSRLRAHEAAAPFDLASPPLVRAALGRTGAASTAASSGSAGADEHVLVVTMHHLLADGWSMPRIVTEVFARYCGEPVQPAADLRDYLRWAAGQAEPAHLAAWRERLAGVDAATRVADTRLSPDMGVAESLTQVPAEQTRRLCETARARGVTVNSMVQTAWALVLASLTGRTDVVFGATVSGRPAELPGVETMVGLFINTLPVRVDLRPPSPSAISSPGCRPSRPA